LIPAVFLSLLLDFWTSLKNNVNDLQKVISRKTFFLISFLLASTRKIAGSGSISERHGYPDPDSHQNVMDPEHCPSG
jgi:hypothetical protein